MSFPGNGMNIGDAGQLCGDGQADRSRTQDYDLH
jgi:hypothetical protein